MDCSTEKISQARWESSGKILLLEESNKSNKSKPLRLARLNLSSCLARAQSFVGIHELYMNLAMDPDDQQLVLPASDISRGRR